MAAILVSISPFLFPGMGLYNLSKLYIFRCYLTMYRNHKPSSAMRLTSFN